MIAIPWYFINIANAGSIFGVLFSTITFITIVWTLYAGTLVDRFNRKKIFLAIDIVGFIFVFSVGIYGYLNHGLPLFLVGAVFMFSMFVFNIHFPTVYAFSQEISDPAYYGRINSMLEIQAQTASMLAGATAAFLLGGTQGKLNWVESYLGFGVNPWDIYDIFILDGITYLVAFFIILPMKYKSMHQRVIDTDSLRVRFKTGLKFLKENRAILWYGILSFAVFIAMIVEGFYLAAIYVSDYLLEDAVIYTLIELSYAFGAIIAGVFIRKVFSKWKTIPAIFTIMIIVSTGFFIVAFTRSNVLFIVFNFFLGMANSGSRILRVTYLFTLIPNQVIGRVNSLFAAYQTIVRGLLIALFAWPFFSDGSHITRSYMVLGGFLIISAVLLLLLTQPLRENRTEQSIKS